MPWKEQSIMSLREDFVGDADAEGANMAAVCRSYGISRKTGYKWLARGREREPDYTDRSRRPGGSPTQTAAEVEQAILDVRDGHATWGARKIRAYLLREGKVSPPASSTVHAILRRAGRITPEASLAHQPLRRFVEALPNGLWQMDFKGPCGLTIGGQCHPLSVLDDCSRFLVGLCACPNETHETVQQALTGLFRTYGLPVRMLMDNGSPWGDDAFTHHTILTTWLMRLDIEVSHSRPYHPQTQGKVERFHRTLKEDLLVGRAFSTLETCQLAFDAWREVYNTQRPHEALGLQPPSACYLASTRPFPERLPPVSYDEHDIVRRVDMSGKISFQHHTFRVGRAFRYELVAIRPTPADGIFDVIFYHQQVALLDLRKPLR